jgi:hypothetical protein
MLIVLLQQNQQVSASGGDVSVALSGQAVTVSAGTLAPSTTVAASGQAAIASAGTLTPSSSKALSGQLVNVSAGTLGVVGDVTVALTGQAVTVSAGTLTASGPVSDVTGGWTTAINRELQRRASERRRRKKLEEESEAIEAETDRQIALLLREQEAKDARKAELERLSALVASIDLRAELPELSERVQKAIKVAATKQTTWALFQLERELQRAQEEEDFVLQALYRALH